MTLLFKVLGPGGVILLRRGPPPSVVRTSYRFLKRKICSKSKKNGTFLQSKSREESKNRIFGRYRESLRAHLDDLCPTHAPKSSHFFAPALGWGKIRVFIHRILARKTLFQAPNTLKIHWEAPRNSLGPQGVQGSSRSVFLKNIIFH